MLKEIIEKNVTVSISSFSGSPSKNYYGFVVDVNEKLLKLKMKKETIIIPLKNIIEIKFK